MADVVLSDGREIAFDLNAFTVPEYRSLFEDDVTPEKADEILARAGGLTLEGFQKLGFLDSKRYKSAFGKAAARPLEDPKSEKESS